MNYLRRKEAAIYLQKRYGAYTVQTLAKLACVGGGPPFRKLGPFPLYTEAELDLWAEAKMTGRLAHTSELESEKAR